MCPPPHKMGAQTSDITVNSCGVWLSELLRGIGRADQAAPGVALTNLIDTSSFAPAPRLPSRLSPLSHHAGRLNAAISQSHLHPKALNQAQIVLV